MRGDPVLAMSPMLGIMLPTDVPRVDQGLVNPTPVELAELRGDPQLVHRVLGKAELATQMIERGMSIDPLVESALARLNTTR